VGHHRLGSRSNIAPRAGLLSSKDAAGLDKVRLPITNNKSADLCKSRLPWEFNSIRL